MTALLASRPRKTISLTALIDVVFILLMFFMLTSSFTTRHETSLSTATAAADNTAEPTEPLQLALSPTGEWLRLPQLQPAAEDWLGAQPTDTPVVVYPQSATQVQTIITRMQQLQQLGFERVNLGDALEP